MTLTPIDYLPACVAGLELAIFGALEHAGAPVVFVTHGRGGAVVDVYGICRMLAGRGMIGVAVEQRNHGRRLVDVRCNGGWSLHHAADMYGVFVGTALDISLLIDLLPARLGIGCERVGVTGVSLGGHATLAAMTVDARITAGAALIGSGDYRRLMEIRAANNGCPADEFDRYFPPSLQAAVEKFDPIHHPERFADRPLLMANGDADTLVPLECNRRFYEAALPHYRDPDRLRLSVYPGLGHDVPPAMLDEACAWLERWLVGE